MAPSYHRRQQRRSPHRHHHQQQQRRNTIIDKTELLTLTAVVVAAFQARQLVNSIRHTVIECIYEPTGVPGEGQEHRRESLWERLSHISTNRTFFRFRGRTLKFLGMVRPEIFRFRGSALKFLRTVGLRSNLWGMIA
jgi:hypothetical protein